VTAASQGVTTGALAVMDGDPSKAIASAGDGSIESGEGTAALVATSGRSSQPKQLLFPENMHVGTTAGIVLTVARARREAMEIESPWGALPGIPGAPTVQGSRKLDYDFDLELSDGVGADAATQDRSGKGADPRYTQLLAAAGDTAAARAETSAGATGVEKTGSPSGHGF